MIYKDKKIISEKRAELIDFCRLVYDAFKDFNASLQSLLDTYFDYHNYSDDFDYVIETSAQDDYTTLGESFHTMLEKIKIDLADYGFLECIAKSRLLQKNIALYTGAAHSKNLVHMLNNIGYETLWLKENDIDAPLSKEECEAFFTIKPIPKSRL